MGVVFAIVGEFVVLAVMVVLAIVAFEMLIELDSSEERTMELESRMVMDGLVVRDGERRVVSRSLMLFVVVRDVSSAFFLFSASSLSLASLLSPPLLKSLRMEETTSRRVDGWVASRSLIATWQFNNFC